MRQQDAEFLEIYNARREPIGTAPRVVVHQEGHWHKTFHAWILTNGEQTGGRILLQRRSAGKTVWPRRLDASAGGHIAPSEPSIVGALREIEEELGIRIAEDRLVPVGMRVGVDEFSPGRKNYELQDVYFIVLEDERFDWRLETSEVDALLSVRIDELLDLLAKRVDRIPATDVSAGQGIGTTPDQHVTPDDFPPTLDNYYYRIAVLADRLLRGEDHLVI